jgi:hypothetical protein
MRPVGIIVLVLVLLIVAFLVWLRVTPDGRDLADDLSGRWQQWRHGGEEQDAARKLAALGAGVVGQEHPLSINCQDKTLGDEGYRWVGKCSGLVEARFLRCDLNDDRMKSLAGLSRLTSLTIFDAPEVTDEGIKQIVSLRGLASLLLKGTSVGDQGLSSIAQLPELKILDLSDTRITDEGMSTLDRLHTLNWLLLADTAVTDEGVAKLGDLRELKQLSLSGSKVTNQGKARLKKMHPGLTIN